MQKNTILLRLPSNRATFFVVVSVRKWQSRIARIGCNTELRRAKMHDCYQ